MSIRTILAVAAGGAFVALLATAQSTALSKSDKAFLDTAANVNMTEAHLGQMAQADASTTPIKDFGQKLSRDHTNAYETLTALAQKVGAEIPKGINVKSDRTVADLMATKGSSFDRLFLTSEVRDHEKVIAEFKREAEHGQDAQVKAYANKMLPVLEDHLHTAQSLEKSERSNG